MYRRPLDAMFIIAIEIYIVFFLQIETLGEPGSGDRLRHFSESAVVGGKL